MSLLSLIPPEIHRYNILPSIKLEYVDTYINVSPTIFEYTKNYLEDNNYWKRRVEFQFNKGISLMNYNLSWRVVCVKLNSNNFVNNSLAEKPNENSRWTYLLMASININKSEYIKLALDMGGDPSINDNAAISWASLNGYTEIVKLLMANKRVDPSAKTNDALMLASENGHIEVVKLLLKDERVVKLLLENKRVTDN